MENLSEGILLIATGVVVVLVLLVLMALLVRTINLVDDFFVARKEKRAAKKASFSTAAGQDQNEVSPEVVAAVSLALQDHLQSGLITSVPLLSGQGSHAWNASGRMEIMAANQRVTNRLR